VPIGEGQSRIIGQLLSFANNWGQSPRLEQCLTEKVRAVVLRGKGQSETLSNNSTLTLIDGLVFAFADQAEGIVFALVQQVAALDQEHDAGD